MVRALAAQWTATLFSGVVSFVLTALIARQMGPGDFGTYASALAVGALFIILTDGGMRTLIMREYARGSTDLRPFAPFLSNFAFTHALVIALVGVLFSTIIIDSSLMSLVLATTFWAFSATLIQTLSARLKGEGRLVAEAGFQAGSRGVTALGIGFFLLFGINQPWQIIAVWSCVSFAYIALCGRNMWRPRFRGLVTLYRACFPFFVAELAITLYIRMDVLFLNYFGIPKSQIGEYAAAFRICEAVIMFSAPIGVLVFRDVRRITGPIEKFRKRFLKFVTASVLVSLVAASLTALFADDIVSALYGDEFGGSVQWMVIFSLMLFFVLPNMVLNQVALATGKEGLTMRTVLFAAMVNGALNFFLIPSYGVTTSAWAKVAAEALVFVLMFSNLSKSFRH